MKYFLSLAWLFFFLPAVWFVGRRNVHVLLFTFFAFCLLLFFLEGKTFFFIERLLNCLVLLFYQTNAKILHIAGILCKTEHVMKLKKAFSWCSEKNVELGAGGERERKRYLWNVIMIVFRGKRDIRKFLLLLVMNFMEQFFEGEHWQFWGNNAVQGIKRSWEYFWM